MTIRNISKDKYHATPVQRSVKSVREALIQGLNKDLTVLTSAFEWSVVSEMWHMLLLPWWKPWWRGHGRKREEESEEVMMPIGKTMMEKRMEERRGIGS